MIINAISLNNVEESDIVKVSNGTAVLVRPVTRVTKSQVLVALDGEERRFRKTDGKEVASNGALVEDGLKMKLNDILRFG